MKMQSCFQCFGLVPGNKCYLKGNRLFWLKAATSVIPDSFYCLLFLFRQVFGEKGGKRINDFRM